MDRAETELALGQGVRQDGREGPALGHKPQAIIHFGGWAGALAPQDLVIVRQVARGDMKTRQGVGQPVGGKIAQQAMEPAQGIADFPGVPGIFDGVKGLGRVNKAQGAPERPAGVNDVVPAVPGQEHAGHLPAAAAAEGREGQTPAHVVAHGAEVPHDQFRLAEHVKVEALQDKKRFCRARQRHQEGVIDIAVAVFPDVQDPALGGELPGHDDQMFQGCAFA